MPDERDVAGDVEARRRAARRARRPRAGRSRRRSRRGAPARAGARSRSRPGSTMKSVGDLDQRVVAREPARAEAVEVAEPPRRARHRVLRPVDERDPAAAGRVQVPHGLGGALARVGADGVDAACPSSAVRSRSPAPPRGSSSSACASVRSSDARISPSTKRCLQVAHHRELVLGVGAGRVQQQPPAARRARPPGSSRPSSCRRGCRRPASRTRSGPCAASGASARRRSAT